MVRTTIGTPSSTAIQSSAGVARTARTARKRTTRRERRQCRPADRRLVHEGVEQDPDELDGEQHRRGLPPEPRKPAGHRRPVYGPEVVMGRGQAVRPRVPR